MVTVPTVAEYKHRTWMPTQYVEWGYTNIRMLGPILCPDIGGSKQNRVLEG